MRKNADILSVVSLVLFIMILSTCFAEEELRVISALEGQIPSDAIVLFDGKDLSEWTGTDGKPSKWIVSNGTMTVLANVTPTMVGKIGPNASPVSTTKAPAPVLDFVATIKPIEIVATAASTPITITPFSGVTI